MKFHTLESLTPYEPKNHVGFVNRKMAGSAVGSDPAVSVTHATIEPGGTSTLHVHESSVQIYVGLTGVTVVGDGEREHELTSLSTVIFEKGTNHFVENRSSELATVLVITSPELAKTAERR